MSAVVVATLASPVGGGVAGAQVSEDDCGAPVSGVPVSDFVPEEGVAYTLMNQNGGVLAGDAEGRDLYAMSVEEGVADPESVGWEFVDSGLAQGGVATGHYHIDLASGGEYG